VRAAQDKSTKELAEKIRVNILTQMHLQKTKSSMMAQRFPQVKVMAKTPPKVQLKAQVQKKR
jgi:hypothetical protein